MTVDADWEELAWDKDPDAGKFGEMLAQMYRYWGWATGHWREVKETWDKIKSPADRRQRLLDTDYFSDMFKVRGRPSEIAVLQKAHITELQAAFEKLPELQQADTNVKEDRRAFDILKKEWDMNVRLALWLCTYFLGIPYSDVWEDIVLMQGSLGAFPGGAFYDKMAGDIYRLERRQYKKRALNGTPPAAEEGTVYVMAYTPLLLIPDERDLNYVSRRSDRGVDTATGGLDVTHYNFMECVEKLACCYLRYQAWRYFQETDRPKVKYAVSHLSVVTALYELTDMLLLMDQCNDSTQYKARKREWCQKSDIDRKQIREGDAWKERFSTLKTESDSRLEYFIEAGSQNCEIAVFLDEATKRRGLTSCILGRDDGVLTNRPNRTDQATAFCTWTEGIVLQEEKQKLKKLWEVPAFSDDGKAIVIRYNGDKNFSSAWTELSEQDKRDQDSDATTSNGPAQNA